MSETDYEALGRYTQHVERIVAINGERARIIQALQRWAAAAPTGMRSIKKLDLDALEEMARTLRVQEAELEQLGHVVNLLGEQLGRPKVHFVAHQVL